MQISHTKSGTWRRCRRKYLWSYVHNWQPPKRTIGQIRGEAGHKALANFYMNHDVETAIQTAWNVYQYEDVHNDKDWNLLELVLRRYFLWTMKKDNFRVHNVEQYFTIDIKGHKLTGYLDLYMQRPDNTFWVVEHKFHKRASLKAISLDMQASIYMLSGLRVDGILYNVIRVAKGGIAAKQPVLRKWLQFQKAGLGIIVNEMVQQADELTKFHTYPPAVQEVVAYRNPTQNCEWDCYFYPACLSLQYDGEADSVLETSFVKKRRR